MCYIVIGKIYMIPTLQLLFQTKFPGLFDIWKGVNDAIFQNSFVTLPPLNELTFVSHQQCKTMNKYSQKAQEKIETVIHEFKDGKLKSGKDGKGGIVKNRKQAIAIGISEAREAGLKVPKENV